MNQKYEIVAEEIGMKFSTGSLAKQANGAVVVSLGETNVIVTAVAAANVSADQDFFPLTVDYKEKFYAAGLMPGGYGKREGRPSEKEILTSRLCDRPLRPLFPKGFLNEVQVIGTLLSTDGLNEADILMVNGASAALVCSDIPWFGPIGCIRVGYVKGQLIANPTNEQMFESELDLIYVGSRTDMMMIEGNANQLPEDKFIEALEFAQKSIQPIIDAQIELAKIVGKEKKAFELRTVRPETMAICESFNDRLNTAVFQDGKLAREAAVAEIKALAKDAIIAQRGEDNFCPVELNMAFEELQEKLYRNNILDHSKRVDGRGIKEIRPIEAQIGVLPIVHGSAVFQRGETQALVVATLGCQRDAQEVDAITGGVETKSFYLHYNFPPFSVGEVGRTGGLGRREIGHGALAERSLSPVIPSEENFPYTVRIVSDILESNGSSSMASVCGGCLALMDAGVPISAPVAGISTGLVTRFDNDGNLQKHVVLTDIIGMEDHFGDMDFKISGTRTGITGVQLDLKIKGLPLEIVKEAISQNREARMEILDIMHTVQPAPRTELSPTAPRFHSMTIDPDKIGALIGPGGKNIKRITDATGAKIDINEDNSGKVLVFAKDNNALKAAIQEIEGSAMGITVGTVYRGKVTSIKEFGVFVECLPGKEGLLHVSEMADFRVQNPSDICQVGDEVVVKCVGTDPNGKVRLSRKAVLCEAKGIAYEPTPARPSRDKPRFGSDSRGGDRPRFGGSRDSRGPRPSFGGGDRPRSGDSRGDRPSRPRFDGDRPSRPRFDGERSSRPRFDRDSRN